MKKFNFILIPILILIYHCGSNENIVNNNNNEPSDYVKIFTALSGADKFEVYSKSSQNFIYGYNELGFKVFLNNSEQNQGFVKWIPTMYHGIGGPNHSIPVPEKYFYNSDKNMFTGYAVFIMYDTSAFWAADFNFNDLAFADSVIFNLHYSSKTKITSWDNTNLQKTFMLTLIAPSAPRVGLNTLDMMLHSTIDMNTYEEINNAEMMIRPWMESMGHGSSNNVDPTWISPAKYRGTVNFNMAGEWYLYDSIKVNSIFITNTPPPKFIMEVN